MSKELRCTSKILHGVLVDGVLEVTCKSRWCGKRPGVVVVHRFNIHTGELIDTRQFAEPTKEVNNNGSREQGDAVRSA